MLYPKDELHLFWTLKLDHPQFKPNGRLNSIGGHTGRQGTSFLEKDFHSFMIKAPRIISEPRCQILRHDPQAFSTRRKIDTLVDRYTSICSSFPFLHPGELFSV
jgi:hypothetical protein